MPTCAGPLRVFLVCVFLKEILMNLTELEHPFSIPGHLSFREIEPGWVVADIANARGECTVALQGGHITHFCAVGQAPLIWVSERAKFSTGKAIRGGVPICWPWFGPSVQTPPGPAHGIARTAVWQVLEAKALADGRTFLRLGLPDTPTARAQWPHPSSAELEITVGNTLTVTLVTRNTGTQNIVVGEALHTYFAISDVANISVSGLDGCDYLDKVDAGVRKTQHGPIQIESEVDRIYLNTSHDCLIDDRGWQRRIRIASEGARATVVWNPWLEKTSQMDDMAPEAYRRMVCVETANAADHLLTVLPGTEHRMSAIYSVEALGG